MLQYNGITVEIHFEIKEKNTYKIKLYSWNPLMKGGILNVGGNYHKLSYCYNFCWVRLTIRQCLLVCLCPF